MKRLSWARHFRVLIVLAGLAFGLGPGTAAAQTVADIRAEVDVLNGQVQQLRDQLVQQGPSGGLPAAPATALERLDQLEAELRALTNRVDVLMNDIDRIVGDASNRVGDIEFRLSELEGTEPAAATAAPAETPLLGGGLTASRPRPRGGANGAQTGEAQLALTERSDFDAAVAAAQEGRTADAIALFDKFLATYPGGPLSGQANLIRGDALAAQGDWQKAARGYLDAFSGAPEAPTAPKALFGLGRSLARIGKTEDACLTLSEVTIRYPQSEEAALVPSERAALRCP